MKIETRYPNIVTAISKVLDNGSTVLQDSVKISSNPVVMTEEDDLIRQKVTIEFTFLPSVYREPVWDNNRITFSTNDFKSIAEHELRKMIDKEYKQHFNK